MRRLLCFLAIPFLALTAVHAEPAKPSVDGARDAAQRFYDQYIKVKETDRWVAQSHAVTPAFKKAFAAAMKKDAEVDLIVDGQDVPASGFKASSPVVKGTVATLIMHSSDPGFPQKIHVRLVFDGKSWLIDGVNEINAKQR